MWRIHRAALEAQAPPPVPAPVIAQAWRNGVKQALLARFLHGCDRVDFTSQTAYAVGDLLAAAGSADVVDAVVGLLAARHGDIIVIVQHRINPLGVDPGVRIGEVGPRGGR